MHKTVISEFVEKCKWNKIIKVGNQAQQNCNKLNFREN